MSYRAATSAALSTAGGEGARKALCTSTDWLAALNTRLPHRQWPETRAARRRGLAAGDHVFFDLGDGLGGV